MQNQMGSLYYIEKMNL